MKTSPFRAQFWAVLVFAFLAAIMAERGACFSHHSEIPESSAFLQYIILFCLIAHWLRVDSRETKALRMWDMGFFLSFAWPIIVPYYLVKTRGVKRALFALLITTVVFFGAFAAGAAISPHLR